MNLSNDLRHASAQHISRRWFLRDCGVGLAGIALAQLLQRDAHGASVPVTSPSPLAPHAPQFAPKAKRVIYLFQAGAPSHLELFDYEPELAKRDGQLPPAELLRPGARVSGPLDDPAMAMSVRTRSTRCC